MNLQEMDILRHLSEHHFENQRRLAEDTGSSLGAVNKGLTRLREAGYLADDFILTEKARYLMQQSRTKRAVILAAGPGMRMVPIHTQTTKGMLEIRGECLVERLIRQLRAVDIYEILIVVGFMKEKYEYLMDKYQVRLIVNREYAEKNNLYSVALAGEFLDDAYIIPCDLWCRENPFRKYELYSWYMVSESEDFKSPVRVNRRRELVCCDTHQMGRQMIGIAYLQKEKAVYLKKKIEHMTAAGHHEGDFWEEALWTGERFAVFARCVPANMVYEINTYEQLRDLDHESKSLDSEVIRIVADVFQVSHREIKNIEVLKKGMTNRSFCCMCQGKRYIMRIPGEGTDRLIDRKSEYDVYQVIKDYSICDTIYYMNPVNGYKLTEFIEDVHVCDAKNREEVRKCMNFLRSFHQKGLKTNHSFDLWEHIEYYESLWDGFPSVYGDYAVTKENVYELKAFIDRQKSDWTLTHIDAVPDNFLLRENGEIFLIDWEYAGMQDPHVDIAMFAIYALYDRESVEFLMDAYFPEGVEKDVRLKIYCYIAVCGLLWSNWCEYKGQQGVEFGEYNLRQYRYAKEYYRIFQEER